MTGEPSADCANVHGEPAGEVPDANRRTRRVKVRHRRILPGSGRGVTTAPPFRFSVGWQVLAIDFEHIANPRRGPGVRVIAVFADGPKRGLQLTLLGQTADELFAVPDPWIPPPIDLGPPMPWEPFRRVTYWYVRSAPAQGLARWRHLYALDLADEDLTWAVRYPPPAWSPPETSAQKAPWWTRD
jgi:hypothetical protein